MLEFILYAFLSIKEFKITHTNKRFEEFFKTIETFAVSIKHI